MEWQVGSVIGMYAMAIILTFGAHFCASAMDEQLYKTSQYNLDRKTMKVGLGWLFWRGKKDDKKEIFIMAFIHEIISVILFVTLTSIFVVSLLQKNEVFMITGLILSLIYFFYCIIMEQYISRKIKKDI